MTLAVPANRRAMLDRMTGQYSRDIIVDATRCSACMKCVEACKVAIAHEHPTREPVARITIKPAASEGSLHLPLLCRNCAEASCVVACMTACRIRDGSGWVTTDYSRCVGCWMCVMTCPFGAIEAVHEEGLARKCDGCTSYDIPPCVAVCEPGALQVASYGNFAHERRQRFGARARSTSLPG
ncbi:MAG: 4Fe-4S binding protein [Ardenticatenaceae bacterium]|nr:4Fe-4S binding protein [Ardenticatenaceae bacterium]